ncbi:hypothetical protein AV654_01400 [Paenibacillus elgii]|uniref:DUF5643 domain-containing protein n=1 Tax=Paenibacillus elgii TaxID=189691 RepID=A0A163Z7C6_9BACL|nr:DUF5643 domain-containing protein [Paenibacillus elgii]KZE81178.1 hypothetical protein AV654_01400 [Paenibacillus elgii]
MKKTTIAVLSAAVLLGGLAPLAVRADATAVSANQTATVPLATQDTKAFNLNPAIQKQYGGATFTLKSLSASPETTEFVLARHVPDGIAKEVDEQLMKMSYLVTDDNGWIYEYQKASEKGQEQPDGSFVPHYTENVKPLQGKPKELTIRPYVGGWYDDTSTMFSDKANVTAPLTGQYPLTLDQGKIGSMSVTGVDFGKDKTILKLAIAGETAAVQKTGTWLVQNGKQLDVTRTELAGVEDGVYQYELEFPAVDRTAPLEVLTKRMTPVTFLKELEMKVQLPQ